MSSSSCWALQLEADASSCLYSRLPSKLDNCATRSHSIPVRVFSKRDGIVSTVLLAIFQIASVILVVELALSPPEGACVFWILSSTQLARHSRDKLSNSGGQSANAPRARLMASFNSSFPPSFWTFSRRQFEKADQRHTLIRWGRRSAFQSSSAKTNDILQISHYAFFFESLVQDIR